MADTDTSGDDDRDKALVLLKVHLLAIQKELLDFCNGVNTKINGLVFDIDQVLSKKKGK